MNPESANVFAATSPAHPRCVRPQRRLRAPALGCATWYIDADDVARAVAVKQALGERASVRVDVNQSWDETTAKGAIAGLEAGGIDVVEQPVAG